MLRYTLFCCVWLLSIVSSSVFALGLGEITLKSHLNQPLVAEIELLQVRDLALNEILPALASRKDFDAAGVERTFLLSTINFQVKLDANGRNIILLTTSKPIREPFLNFLVEVLWPSGRLLREYTLLLDPPTYANNAPQAIKPAAQASQSAAISSISKSADKPSSSSSSNGFSANSSSSASSSNNSSSKAAQTPANIFKQPTASGNAIEQPKERSSQKRLVRKQDQVATSGDQRKEIQAGENYRVKSNDNLWAIANDMRQGSSANVHQVMVAIQKENPTAFVDDNINRLKSGAILRTPSASSLTAVDKRAAIQEVERQNKIWKSRLVAKSDASQLKGRVLGEEATPDEPAAKDQEGGHLKLVAGDAEQSKSGTGGEADNKAGKSKEVQSALIGEELDKARLKNQDLEERVGSLTQQITDSKKLIDLKSQQFSELNARLAQIEEENARLKKQLNLPTSAPTAEPVITEQVVTEPVAVEPVVEAAVETPAAAQPAVEATPPAEPVVASTPAEAPLEGVSNTDELSATSAPADSIQSGDTAPAMSEADINAAENLPVEDLNFANETPAPTEAPAIVAVEPTPESTSLVDQILQKPMYWMIAGGSILVLLAAWLLWRRSQQEEEEDSDEIDESGNDDATTLANLDPMSGFGAATVPASQDHSYNRYTNSGSKPAVPGETVQNDQDNTQALRDIVSDLDNLPDAFSDSDLIEEATDILGEADIYIAYGRFDQAEEVLVKAIKRDQSHPEFYLKLMEVYAEKHDADRFAQIEKQLLNQSFSADFSQRIAELRNTLGSDASVSKQEVLDTLPTASPEETQPLESAAELDFDLSDNALPDATETFIYDTGIEDDNDASDLKDLKSNLLDRSLDENHQDDTHHAKVAPSHLLDADLDEQDSLKFTLDETESLLTTQSDDEVISPRFVNDDLSQDDLLKVDLDNPADMETLAADLDAILVESDNRIASQAKNITGISEVSADEFLASDDEVSTKLDLARAYMDMGDREGAKDILQEVIKEGSASQQQEAQSLLKKIG